MSVRTWRRACPDVRAERFECRWATVAVLESPALLLRGMAGSVLGVWCAHGEGRALFPDVAVRDAVFEGRQAPLRYADSRGEPTEAYPANPNGSPAGVAALCSPDGRHLAMMPHPERCAPWDPRPRPCPPVRSPRNHKGVWC